MGKNLALLRYLWEISRALPGSWKQKKRILSAMASSIRDYVSEGSDISYEQLKARFGEPKQIASTYVMDMEAEDLLESLQTKRIVVAVATAIIVTAGIWLVTIVDAYVNHKKDMAGYAVVEVIEYERIEIDEGGELD